MEDIMEKLNRVLLKLSGEALAGDKKTGFDEETVVGVAKQVKVLVNQGISVGIVIGGGNFWRGRTSEKIDRTKADETASGASDSPYELSGEIGDELSLEETSQVFKRSAELETQRQR